MNGNVLRWKTGPDPIFPIGWWIVANDGKRGSILCRYPFLPVPKSLWFERKQAAFVRLFFFGVPCKDLDPSLPWKVFI